MCRQAENAFGCFRLRDTSGVPSFFIGFLRPDALHMASPMGWCSAQRIQNWMIAGGNHTIMSAGKNLRFLTDEGRYCATIFRGVPANSGRGNPHPSRLTASHLPQRGRLCHTKLKFILTAELSRYAHNYAE